MRAWNRLFRVQGVACAFVVAIAMTITSANPAMAKEALNVIGGYFDFGYIPFGTLVKHRAILINQCDSIVKITRVVPGCGCTQIPLKKKQLAPQESLEVEIIMDTGKIHQGLFKKAPTIYTDNVETPRVVISLEGFNLGTDDTQPLIGVTPNSLHFRKGQANPTDTVQIENKNSRGIVAKLADAPRASFINVQMPYREIAFGKHEPMIVTLKSSALHEDTMDESVTIVFNDLKRTRITLPISITR